ncbi:MAG: DUF2490 domain-containing protein [Bacteroidia bacterium]|nr:DUF2490 domain-containing protein [Bacteroidia bacterium]
MKRVYYNVLIFVFLFLFVSENIVVSQTVYPDAGSWNTINIEKKFTKKITVLFTEELRFKENFSRLNLFYTNLGVEYKFSDFFKAAFVYRFIEKYQDDNTFSFRHRLMLDLTVKKKFGNFGVSYRQRIQAEERDIYSSDAGAVPEWYSRNKVAIKYDSDKRYTPYVAMELRYQFHNPREWQSDYTWHRSRYSFGVDYKLNKKNTFGLYYLIQREYNVVLPQNQYIVGLEYSLSL